MSKNILCISILFILSGTLSAQYKTEMKKLYSKNVKDSFEIYVSQPKDFSKEKSYDVVYYCDANLKSGKKLRELISNGDKLSKNKNIVFVGIGHIGNFHVLRRRDFITPFIKNGDTTASSEYYGHIQEFYFFLIKELIPSAESKFKSSGKRTIIGHSLGGLFVFYCLFQNDTYFQNYIALSPALWINNYNIYQFNKIRDTMKAKSYLYFSAGSLEVLNYILAGANQMNSFLSEKKIKNLDYEYQVQKSKDHNSAVPVALEHVLQKL